MKLFASTLFVVSHLAFGQHADGPKRKLQNAELLELKETSLTKDAVEQRKLIRGSEKGGPGGSGNNGSGGNGNNANPHSSVNFNPKGKPFDGYSSDIPIQKGQLEADGLGADFDKVPVIKFQGISEQGHRPLIFHKKDISVPAPVVSRAPKKHNGNGDNRKALLANKTNEADAEDSFPNPLMWYGEEQGQGVASATFVLDVDGSIAGMVSDSDVTYQFNTEVNNTSKVIHVMAMKNSDMPEENNEDGSSSRLLTSRGVNVKTRVSNKDSQFSAGPYTTRELQDTCPLDDDECDMPNMPCDNRLGYYGEWHDSRGPLFTCAWYGKSGSRCTSDGDDFENFGYTANRACCHCGGGGVEIDVMFVTTDGARNSAGGKDAMEREIFLYMLQTNIALELSGITARVRLVHIDHDNTYESSQSGSGNLHLVLQDLKDSIDGHLDGVHSKRTQYGADVVALVVDNLSEGCGKAGGNGVEPETMKKTDGFLVVKNTGSCSGRYAFSHELGHILGGRHHRSDDESGIDNHGYITPDGKYASLMAYVSSCSQLHPSALCKKALRYSNTRYMYNGYKMGDKSFANVGKTIEIRSRVVKDFRSTKQNCNVDHQHWIGDGYCDKGGAYNTAICGWDGGDCCEEVCVDDQYSCGSYNYDCKDPAVTKGVEIVSEKNGECLDMKTDSSKNVYVHQCHGGNHQKWIYVHSTREIKSARNNECLDLSTSSSSNVYVHGCHGGNNQKWTYDAASDAFKNDYNPSKCMDMKSDKDVVVYNCHYNSNQKWQVPDSFFLSNTGKDGSIWLSSQHFTCLEMSGSNQNVISASCSSETRQKWVYYASTKQIKSAENNECLDYNYSTNNLYVHPCHGGENQKWAFDTPHGGALRSYYYYWSWDPWMCISYDGGNVVMESCDGGNSNQKWGWPSDFFT